MTHLASPVRPFPQRLRTWKFHALRDTEYLTNHCLSRWHKRSTCLLVRATTLLVIASRNTIAIATSIKVVPLQPANTIQSNSPSWPQLETTLWVPVGSHQRSARIYHTMICRIHPKISQLICPIWRPSRAQSLTPLRKPSSHQQFKFKKTNTRAASPLGSTPKALLTSDPKLTPRMPRS